METGELIDICETPSKFTLMVDQIEWVKPQYTKSTC